MKKWNKGMSSVRSMSWGTSKIKGYSSASFFVCSIKTNTLSMSKLCTSHSLKPLWRLQKIPFNDNFQINNVLAKIPKNQRKLCFSHHGYYVLKPENGGLPLLLPPPIIEISYNAYNTLQFTTTMMTWGWWWQINRGVIKIILCDLLLLTMFCCSSSNL